MSNFRVLVVDDEKHARDDLAWLLQQVEPVAEVLLASSGTEALRLLNGPDKIDAVFLDVQMPNFTGMDFLRVLDNYEDSPAVVLVTAFDEYAVEAFSFDVCDYLVKPVEQARLAEAVRRIGARSSNAREREAGVPAKDDKGLMPYLTGKLGSVPFRVERNDVLLVQAAGDYIEVVTNEKSFLVRESISTLTSAWSAHGFVRIHRSYLVRLDAVTEVCRVDSNRTLKIAGRELPISRRYSRLLQSL